MCSSPGGEHEQAHFIPAGPLLALGSLPHAGQSELAQRLLDGEPVFRSVYIYT